MNWQRVRQESKMAKVRRSERPATPAQMRFLRSLSEETGETFPRDLDVQEASDWIEKLKKKKGASKKRRGTFEKNQ